MSRRQVLIDFEQGLGEGRLPSSYCHFGDPREEAGSLGRLESEGAFKYGGTGTFTGSEKEESYSNFEN